MAISVGISAFNSLTLSPAMSAAFLRHRGDVHFAPFRWFNSGFDWLSHAYARSVRALIRFRWTMLTLFVGGLGATYLVSLRIPSTFLPVEDQGYFFVVIQLPDGASLERTDGVAKQVRDILQSTPGVDIVGSIIVACRILQWLAVRQLLVDCPRRSRLTLIIAGDVGVSQVSLEKRIVGVLNRER